MSRRMQKTDDAVSPVVGVMLMLVVTIIIAAVVSAFAGGIGGDTKSTPQASFGVEVDLSNNATIFDHRGGDTLDLNEIAIVFGQDDTKITLTRLDVGSSRCEAFEKVGDLGTIIRPGDRFIIQGEGFDYTELGMGSGIAYGSMTIADNKRASWTIMDRSSNTPIASGTFFIN